MAVYLLLRVVVGDQWWWLALLHNFAPYYFVPVALLLPAAMIARAWKAALRLIPLLLVGLLWFGPYWLPKTITATFDNRVIKVVTFNILPLDPQLDLIADWLLETDADVILLQELGPANAAVISAALQDTYPYAEDLPGTTQLSLSRYPVQSLDLVMLDAWVAERMTIDINGEMLAVYNIHLAMPVRETPHFTLPFDNGLLHLALQYDETHRNNMIRVLLAVLAAEELPYIVAGDFNTSDNAVIYGEMAAVMRDAFREVGTGLGATWPAGTAEEALPDVPPLLRIDYVWHSTGFRARSAEVGPKLGSDHLPLVVALELP